VPAGESLAIDRELFSAGVESAIASHPRISCGAKRPGSRSWGTHFDCFRALGAPERPERNPVLPDRDRSACISSTHRPGVELDSLDLDQTFAKNRWDKGSEPDFLNSPWTRKPFRLRGGVAAGRYREPKALRDGQLFGRLSAGEEDGAAGPETCATGPCATQRRKRQNPSPSSNCAREPGNAAVQPGGLPDTPQVGHAKGNLRPWCPPCAKAVFARFGAMHIATPFSIAAGVEPPCASKARMSIARAS